MKKISLAILANSDTQANFLNYRTLKRIGFISDIQILKENHTQHQFTDQYFKKLGGQPQLIIFEFHKSSDVHVLENLKKFDTISIVVWGVDHYFSPIQKEAYPNMTFISQLPSAIDIQSSLKKGVARVA